MKLKKLLPELASNIINLRLDQSPKAIQSLAIPKIKSGADMFVLAPDGEGKTTALAISLVQFLKSPVEEAPRAIVMVGSKEEAFSLEEQFQKLAYGLKLRSFVVFDEGLIHYQKNTIYEGVDLVIGTPLRLNELISTTGIPLTKVRFFAVDDCHLLTLNQYAQIYRIADNVEKAQYVIFSNEWKDNYERIEERMMRSPLIIENSEE